MPQTARPPCGSLLPLSTGVQTQRNLHYNLRTNILLFVVVTVRLTSARVWALTRVAAVTSTTRFLTEYTKLKHSVTGTSSDPVRSLDTVGGGNDILGLQISASFQHCSIFTAQKLTWRRQAMQYRRHDLTTLM
jgi:hypothetical protein